MPEVINYADAHILGFPVPECPEDLEFQFYQRE